MSKSLSKTKYLPREKSQKDLTLRFRYSGSSMLPTFRTGQVLYVRPDVKDMRRGDVVVYEQEGRYIVHRVVSVEKDGFITRGDNNPLTDVGPILPTQVIGRVEMGEHWGEINPVRSGWRGLWMARINHLSRRLDPLFRFMFGWPYRLLKASRIISRVWKPAISRISFRTETGMLVKFIYNQKTVAVWEANQGRFECRKPFDLVIFHP